MKRNLTVVLALLCCGAARADLPAELLGNWVWPIENRSLMVLKLENGAKGAAGTIQAPVKFTLTLKAPGTDLTIEHIQMPVATYPLTWVRETPDGQVLSYPRQEAKSCSSCCGPTGRAAR